MTAFTIHTIESAPEASKPHLEASLKEYGMVPNLHAVMAEAPGLLQAYREAHQLFTETSFDKDELTVVWQAINVEHNCHYCVPAHTGIAKSMGVADDIIDALRDETPLANPKLEALRTFTLTTVRDRGNVNEAALQAFFDAGYTQKNVLEVILGLSQKVMSNYTNHFADTPVDEPFKVFDWTKKV